MQGEPLFTPPHAQPSTRLLLDPQQRGEESQGVRMFFVVEDHTHDNGLTLHLLMQPTTPDASKARICVTKSGTPYFTLTPIGPDAEKRNSELSYGDRDIDADERFWATKSTDFRAIDPTHHPLAFGLSTNRPIESEGADSKGSHGSSGWGPNSEWCHLGSMAFRARASQTEPYAAGAGSFQRWERIPLGRYRVSATFGCNDDSYYPDLKKKDDEVTVPNTLKGSWSVSCDCTLN